MAVRSAEATELAAPPVSPWPARLLAVLIAAMSVLHLTWLHTVRAGGPVDIDEAWYLGMALRASSPSHRLVTGPVLLWREPGYQAPLLALVTDPFHYVFGRSIEVSYFAIVLFLALLLWATYALARRFVSGWWALLAAGVVATTPGIIDYARHYHFALPATSLFTVSLFTLVASRRFTERRWVIAFGVALGTVVLARTIMLAFAPGLVVAAALAVRRLDTRERPRAWRHLVLALGIAGLVAASWYVLSYHDVWDYLTGFGYGAESTDYGATTISSAAFWLSDLATVVNQGFYLPLALVLAAGAALGWMTGGPSRHGLARRALDSQAVLVALPLAFGFAALLTTRNIGSGFVVPLLPATVVLAIAALSRARPRPLATAVAAALLAICLVNVTMKSGLPVDLEPQSVHLADWADLPIYDQSSVIDRYVRIQTGEANDRSGAWNAAVRRVLDLSARRSGGDGQLADILTTIEGPMFNANVLILADALEDSADRTLASIGPQEVAPDSDPAALAAYFRTVRASGVDQLVTGPKALSWPGSGYPEPIVTDAARAAGFTPQGRVVLPDGREVTLWAT